MQSSSNGYAEHIERVGVAARKVGDSAINAAIEAIANARDSGKTVYLAGNGGSSATASHFANDLGKGAGKSGKTPIRVINLSDNTPWLTAIANDDSYDNVFAEQLKNFGTRGDVFIAISASGNSRNLILATEYGNEIGATTIGFLGFEGGQLLHTVQIPVHSPTDVGEYEIAEDCHSILCHAVVIALRDN